MNRNDIPTTRVICKVREYVHAGNSMGGPRGEAQGDAAVFDIHRQQTLESIRAEIDRVHAWCLIRDEEDRVERVEALMDTPT